MTKKNVATANTEMLACTGGTAQASTAAPSHFLEQDVPGCRSRVSKLKYIYERWLVALFSLHMTFARSR